MFGIIQLVMVRLLRKQEGTSWGGRLYSVSVESWDTQPVLLFRLSAGLTLEPSFLLVFSLLNVDVDFLPLMFMSLYQSRAMSQASSRDKRALSQNQKEKSSLRRRIQFKSNQCQEEEDKERSWGTVTNTPILQRPGTSQVPQRYFLLGDRRVHERRTLGLPGYDT